MEPPPTVQAVGIPAQPVLQAEEQAEVLHDAGALDVPTQPEEPSISEESNAEEHEQKKSFKPPDLLSLQLRCTPPVGMMRPGGFGLRGGPFHGWRGSRPLLMGGFFKTL
jgi:hypothetical protein